MRVLIINDTIADIDEDTSIGVDFEAWDITDPGNRRVNSSNTFTIPNTYKNARIFGNADDPQSIDNSLFDSVVVSFWAEGQRLLNKAVGRVTQIADRITLLCYEKRDVWQDLEDTTFEDFAAGLMTYLNANHGVPISTDMATGYTNLDDFIDGYLITTTPTSGVCVPYMGTNLANSDNVIEVSGKSYFQYYSSEDSEILYGAHVCVYVKALFEYLEYYMQENFGYTIDFFTNSPDIAGNVWGNTGALHSFMFVPYINLSFVYNSATSTYSFYFDLDTDRENSPWGVPGMGDKNMLEFLKVFMQTYGIVLDYYEEDSTSYFKMSRFDDLTDDDIDIVDWSGKIDKDTTPIYKPILDGYAIKNYIKYSSVLVHNTDYLQEDSDSDTVKMRGALTLTSSNKNLDSEADLFSIETYFPMDDLINVTMTYSECASNFLFMVYDTDRGDTVTYENYIIQQGDSTDPEDYVATTSVTSYPPKMYQLSDAYSLMQTIVNKPTSYELKMWFKPVDFKDLRFYKLYYIKELNGAFFLTKIDGYNPSESKEATKVYLLKISSRTPDNLTL